MAAALPVSNGQWHLDEIFVMIDGRTNCLWRAVDHEGDTLEFFVSTRRDRMAAVKFSRKPIKHPSEATVFVTDKFRSYGPARKF
jgi:putative transposase